MKVYYWVSDLLNFLTTVSMGSLVLFKDPHKKLYRTFAFFCGSLAFWAFFHLLWQSLDDTSILYLEVLMLGAIWVPTAFFHYTLVLLNKEDKFKWFIRLSYLISAVFSVFDLTSRLFIAGKEPMLGLGSWPVPGPVFTLHLGMFLGVLIVSHLLLLQEIQHAQGLRQMQLKYCLAASIIACAGGLPNYLPCYHISINPWSNILISFYVGIMTYAIIKHRLMDINIIIRKTLLYGFALAMGIAIYIIFVAHFTHRAMLPLSNFSILTSFFSAAMAIFVVRKEWRRKLNVLWAFTCLAIAFWGLGLGMTVRSTSYSQATFWQTWFFYGGAILIPSFFLHFVSLLVQVNISPAILVSYCLAGIFEVLNFAGKLVVAEAKPPFRYYPTALVPLHNGYTFYFIAVGAYAHWLLYKGMQRSEGAIKNQIKYVFLGTSIGFCGGVTTFLLIYGIHFFPIGVYVVCVYLIMITYAIYKHHLMDINVVLRKSLVYSLMTGSLAAVYLLIVTQWAPFLQNLFGASAVSISIMALCLITVVFHPLQVKVQAFVDRHFFPGWADRESVREVAAGFSHELKSPLAGLSMQVQQTLMELEEIEKGQGSLRQALPKIKQDLNYLLDKAMDAARRIEAVRGVAEPIASQIGPVDVPSVIDSGLSNFKSRLGQASVSVRRDLPADLPLVRSNEKQLEIVFINLVKNALDAMEGDDKEHHILSLSGRAQNGSVLISVKDTGPGIAGKDVARIFEPYYSTKGRKGTGMGLYLTQQIIKAHGGTIDVKSEAGKGTEFTVRLLAFKPVSGSGMTQAA